MSSWPIAVRAQVRAAYIEILPIADDREIKPKLVFMQSRGD
jgi:hypothetical protein